MSTIRPAAQTACDLIEHVKADLSGDACLLLRVEPNPALLVQKLIDRGLVRDARHVLAHALPRRRALWWACLCAWDVRESAPHDGLEAALETVIAFVRRPSESRRRAAEALYRRQSPTSLAAHLTAAVFYSGGSIAPADEAPVAPPPHVMGRLVSTAVYLAAVCKNIKQYTHHMREYVQLGVQIGDGENLWRQAAAPRSLRLDEGNRAHALRGMHAPFDSSESCVHSPVVHFEERP